MNLLRRSNKGLPGEPCDPGRHIPAEAFGGVESGADGSASERQGQQALSAVLQPPQCMPAAERRNPTTPGPPSGHRIFEVGASDLDDLLPLVCLGLDGGGELLGLRQQVLIDRP